jgi:tetratricopeptide (TPR) repeat protein
MRRAGPALALGVLLAGAMPVRGAAQCADGSAPPCRGLGPPLDTARYVILPFAHREGSQAIDLDGADCAEFLSEAFGRWTDVRLTDKTRIYDALYRRRAASPFRIPFDAARAIARQLGAGRVVIGQLWNFGDTLRLTAGVYDAARAGPPLREATARVPATTAHAGAAFNALAASLLGADPGPAAGTGAEATRSLRAYTAARLGQRALRAWDLSGAARAFRSAIAADSEFAHAYVWLGQALMWAADSSVDAAQDRATIARRASALVDRLGPADRALLLAQRAMFEHRWPDACARYREVLARDSLNFDAWYGLAQCNAEDPVVVRDPRDSARFVFRGSWHTAALAYRMALRLAPSFNFAFGSSARERMARLLLAEEFWWREGRFDTLPFFAFPEAEGDTVAFYALSGVDMARGGHRPKTQARALAMNRNVLSDITTAWVEAFPQDPVAHRALSYALEVSGKIAPTVGEQHTAVGEMAAAQRLERRSLERKPDAVATVRLFLKAGDFEAARRTGDSLLRTIRGPTSGVAGVAVLLGRPALAARLVAVEDTFGLHGSADNESVRLPFSTGLVGLRLLAYAAVGGPRDSIEALESRIENMLGTVPAPGRGSARSALLDLPAELVFGEMGLRPAHRSTPPGPDATMTLQWALAHDDTAFVRAKLEPWSGASPEYAFLWARAALALGDTATAEHFLDGTLSDLTRLYSALLDYMPLAGSLVRVMALRAELAAARGEAAAARRWATAVVDLWSGAEAVVHPTVSRMRSIAQSVR